jgi:hypothetical protein
VSDAKLRESVWHLLERIDVVPKAKVYCRYGLLQFESSLSKLVDQKSYECYER